MREPLLPQGKTDPLKDLTLPKDKAVYLLDTLRRFSGSEDFVPFVFHSGEMDWLKKCAGM